MGVSLMQLLIILLVILILFGAGKLPRVMGDLGRGLKAFRDEMKDDKDKDDKHKGDKKDN